MAMLFLLLPMLMLSSLLPSAARSSVSSPLESPMEATSRIITEAKVLSHFSSQLFAENNDHVRNDEDHETSSETLSTWRGVMNRFSREVLHHNSHLKRVATAMLNALGENEKGSFQALQVLEITDIIANTVKLIEESSDKYLLLPLSSHAELEAKSTAKTKHIRQHWADLRVNAETIVLNAKKAKKILVTLRDTKPEL